jgi:hypothetical protein
VIAANQRPDHCTVGRFRQRHEAALGGLFGELLALCAPGRAGRRRGDRSRRDEAARDRVQ